LKEYVEAHGISNALKGGTEPTYFDCQFDPNNHFTTSVVWVFDFVNNCQFQFLKIFQNQRTTGSGFLGEKHFLKQKSGSKNWGFWSFQKPQRTDGFCERKNQ
jgi:hypothetical protein